MKSVNGQARLINRLLLYCVIPLHYDECYCHIGTRSLGIGFTRFTERRWKNRCIVQIEERDAHGLAVTCIAADRPSRCRPPLLRFLVAEVLGLGINFPDCRVTA